MTLSRLNLGILTTVWALGVVFCLCGLAAYEGRPGAKEPAPACWPEDSLLAAPAGRYRLLMFVHPGCPCTRASVAELGKLLSHTADRADVDVVVFRPDAEAEAWAETGLWDSLCALAGVRVRHDRGGREARRFRAATSGHVALFDAHGALRFHGGITATRGHEGDNAGSDAVRAFLRQGASATIETPVFGCPIYVPASPRQATAPEGDV